MGNDMPSKVGTLSGGDYIYFGVHVGLTNIVNSSAAKSHSSIVELALNVDRVLLFRSSTYSLWPVLGCMTNLKPQQVFIIALYGGHLKRNNLSLLQETVVELNDLLTNGLNINRKPLGFTLKFCVCDAVAETMMRCIKHSIGYYGCDKFCQNGVYDGRMTYPECETPVRDNESFRQHSNVDHHTGMSPVCELPIDIIKLFPINCKHQMCLGVMKRLFVG